MPARGMNYLSWDDARAYASWSGLRPMTEMEFEKAGRGASAYGPESGKATYPWGNEAPSTTTGGVEGGTHTIYHANYYVSGISLKPIQVGWYLAQSYANNDYTGASIYGVTDLAGNNWEHMINCQGTATPANGNGTVDYSGLNWPNASLGKGIRGAGWNNSSTNLRVSNRNNAGWTNTNRNNNVGFRPAKTLSCQSSRVQGSGKRHIKSPGAYTCAPTAGDKEESLQGPVSRMDRTLVLGAKKIIVR